MSWYSRFGDLPLNQYQSFQTKSCPFCPHFKTHFYGSPKTHLMCTFVTIYTGSLSHCLQTFTSLNLTSFGHLYTTMLSNRNSNKRIYRKPFFCFIFTFAITLLHIFNNGQYGVWHSLCFLISCILPSEEGVNDTVTVCELPVSGEDC